MSPACTGSRIVRPVLAMPRVIAWRIHHVAYVENLKPLRQSNFSTACIRPRLPSWIRSSSGRPGRLVLLGDRDDEAQVRLHERPLRVVAVPGAAPQLPLLRRREALGGVQLLAGVVAPLDLLRQANLVVLGEQRVLPDVGEVEPDEVFLVPLNSLFRQPINPSFGQPSPELLRTETP